MIKFRTFELIFGIKGLYFYRRDEEYKINKTQDREQVFYIYPWLEDASD